MGRKFEDLTGQVFGRLIVKRLNDELNTIERERVKNGEISRFRRIWECECACGNICNVKETLLKSGDTKSCGCLMIEKAKEQADRLHKYYNLKYNEYEFLENDIIKGWDTKHENFFLIDKIDYDIVKDYCWYKHHSGYWFACKRENNKKSIAMHQLIMIHSHNDYSPSNKIIPDHLNLNRWDNRRCNLELKTFSENQHNRNLNKNNTSGRKGVNFDISCNKWVAQISNNGNILKKRFNTFEDACKQREEWENAFGFIGIHK